MAKGVTIDLIVDPKGAIEGIDKASGSASGATSIFASLGSIGATAIAAVAGAAIAAAGALTAATVSAGKYADEILEAATNTNIGTDELQAYRYAAEQMDVSFDTFILSQGKFTKSMEAATAGTGPAAEGFAALGLSVTDSSGQLVDSETLYWQAIDALGGVANETERTALAQQLFGRGGAEMNSIIAKGSEGFAALTEEARRNGAIMSGPQLEALGAFDDKMQGLTATVDAAKNALGLTLLPILDQLAGDGTSALGEFTSALLDADGDLTAAGPAFESLGTNIAEALTSAVPKILEVGSSLVSGLVEGIVAKAPTLIQTAIPLLVSFVTGILAMLPAILSAGLKILIALAQGIVAALPQLIPAAVEAVIGLVTALVDNLPMLLEAGIQLLLAVGLGLVEAIPQLLEALPTIITSLITAIIGAIPQLVMAGVQLLVAIVKNLPAIIEGIVSVVPAIGDALIAALGDPKLWNELGDAGFQLVSGLWEGIKGAGDWLWKHMSSFFGDVIKNIKNLFGIHSPSTVFAGFGLNMIAGLEKGLTGSNDLTSIMSGLSQQLTGGLPDSLNVSARASVTGAGASPLGGAGGAGGRPQVAVTVSSKGGIDLLKFIDVTVAAATTPRSGLAVS
jgi:hypothetical protein